MQRTLGASGTARYCADGIAGPAPRYLLWDIGGGRPARKLWGVRSRYWSDDVEDAAGAACTAADLSFALAGRVIPFDYPLALSLAVTKLLPWLASVRAAGLRLALGAESANGWQRDDSDGALIYLPQRARLVLRLPLERIDDARALAGSTLWIADCSLRIGSPNVVALSPVETLYARHVIDETHDENLFLDRVAQAMHALGSARPKLMCGKSRRIAAPEGALTTRSVMLASLAPRESLALMANGIGTGRLLGCGLFMPYKRPASTVRGAED